MIKMIKDHKCSTPNCNEKSEYINLEDKFCHCKKCSLHLHSFDKCKKIGNPEIIKELLRISSTMKTKLKEFIYKRELGRL